MSIMQQSGTRVNLTSSGAISTVSGSLIGYHVNSTSSGTIIFKNGGTGGTALSGTITPSAGFNAFPAYFTASACATIGGTLDVTFFFAAG